MKLILTSFKKTNSVNPLSDDDHRIHEGLSYQATIPHFLNATSLSTDHGAILYWQPTDSISDKDLSDYIDYAHGKYRMNEEQALAILQICEYNISNSKLLMEQYRPDMGRWTSEEKFLFEQAYQYYGKVFSDFRKILPKKSTAELVDYYYSWKKTRLYNSLMDKHEKQCKFMPYDIEDDQITNTRDFNNRSESTSDDGTIEDQECSNCEITSTPMYSTPKGILCNECFIYWQKSSLMRPELYRNKSSLKKLKQPPKNMCLDLNSVKSNESIDPIEKLEDDIRHELSVIQLHNQSIEYLTNQSREELETMHTPFLEPNRNLNDAITSTWSTEEILLAIQAFGKYEKDFHSVSRIIGPTKSIHDIENFFVEYRERYQLDMVIDMNSKPIANMQDDTVLISR
ncbi:unnamed protein product [Rotaria socialis]|uniref:Uncharacterized protein n=1 Tax=Rotaria socialis TaxID=392032 RepID=A0A820KZ29_9BILA|nr:unnamed protein product [Rotaria socialis]CAF4352600.1 unnamed protein product [Rotaria socialis]